MGFVGGVLIAKWAVTLCRDAAAQLVDAVPTEAIVDQISKRLTKLDDVQVADLHVWELAPGKRGCIVSLVSAKPRDVDFYRKEILGVVQLAHLTVEIHGCVDCEPAGRKSITA
jgi:Co/Zn/Cd efflux system component